MVLHAHYNYIIIEVAVVLNSHATTHPHVISCVTVHAWQQCASSLTKPEAGLSSHTHWECDTLISLPSHSHTPIRGAFVKYHTHSARA